MPVSVSAALRPLPYHEALAAYLATHEPETWAWFDSAQVRADYAEALKLDLLKQTYRLDLAAFPDLAVALTDATAALGLQALPVTVYQSHHAAQLNAALYFLPGEAHIVLDGGVLQLLTPAELRGVLGHELAHYVLWNDSAHRFLVTDRIAQAMAHDPRAEPAHGESARLLRLYTEIYADRGALRVTGDPAVVISGLIKMHTGLAQVDVASYVRQADEIFAKSKARTEELSHPEAFIRARALTLWAEASPLPASTLPTPAPRPPPATSPPSPPPAPEVDVEITRMLEGRPPLEKLDLLGQQRLTALTQRWLRRYLRPAWFHTDAVRGQARLYFPAFTFPAENHADEALLLDLRGVDLSVRDYLCYVLLDFIAIDPDLADEPLRNAFELTAPLGWDDRLEALAIKDLKLKKRDAQRLHAEAVPSAPRPPSEPAGPSSGPSAAHE